MNETNLNRVHLFVNNQLSASLAMLSDAPRMSSVVKCKLERLVE